MAHIKKRLAEAGSWRPQAHRCQPNTAQGSFLAACQKQRSCPRLGQRLCAVSRGEGRAKKRGQCGRISRATEASGTRPRQPCSAQAEGAAGPHGADASAQRPRIGAPRKRGPHTRPRLSRRREPPTRRAYALAERRIIDGKS